MTNPDKLQHLRPVADAWATDRELRQVRRAWAGPGPGGSPSATDPRGSDPVNLALWIVTGVLAGVLLLSTSKAFVPRGRIAAVGHAGQWVMDFSPTALRMIALFELLAVLGLILPGLLHVAPVLVPATALCVALLFVGATIMRLRRGERGTILPDLVYLVMALFIAWGRFGPAPLS